MDRRTFLTAAGTGAAALSVGALSAPSATAGPASTAAGTDTAQLLAWFRDTYRSIEAMTTDFGSRLGQDRRQRRRPRRLPSDLAHQHRLRPVVGRGRRGARRHG